MNNWALVSSKLRIYQTLTLIKSIRKTGDQTKIWILSTDREGSKILRKLIEPYKEIEVFDEENIMPQNVLDLKKQRFIFAYHWTLKPAFIQFIMNHVKDGSKVTYVDADILFFQNVNEYLKDKNYSVFFTQEERYIPPEKKSEFKDIDSIAGEYNSGFISFRKDEDGLKCLNWWKERCIESCDIDEHTFGDQKYLNEVPRMFKNVVFEPSVRLNVGPWNVLEHKITECDGDIYFGDNKLYFYHFASFRLKNKDKVVYLDSPSDDDGSFLGSNPSCFLLYEKYTQSLKNTIREIEKEFPDFNGYTDQEKNDWSDFQRENKLFNQE